MASSRHGSAVRGMDNVPRSSIRDQRFGRMFRYLPAADFDDAALTALGATMQQGEFLKAKPGEAVDTPLGIAEPDDENPDIAAGFTYLGQFIDHDITFDPMSSLDRFNDPDALQDFRTPRLDLDSVYGSGPDDQPFLYDEDGKHMLLGENRAATEAHGQKPDLPRNRHFDEKLPLENRTQGGGDFAKTQQIVRWHYQWIVLHDFLPRIVGPDTYRQVVVGRGQSPELNFYDAKGRYAYIPVEFSVAAYRYGHSMVRPSYSLSTTVTGPDPVDQPFGNGTAKFNRIPIFSILQPTDKNMGRANLNGFRELPEFWGVDWGLFFDGVPSVGKFKPKPGKGEVARPLPQPSYKLDSTLVDPLTFLPEFLRSETKDVRRQSLAVRNLLRGWRMGLPSGQSVARRMNLANVPVLSDQQLFQGDERLALLQAEGSKFVDNCPLWFYVLREAEVLAGSKHLGRVGGTIVAEVLAGLIMEDRSSFLAQWPNWRPTLPSAPSRSSKNDKHFTMADLINFTEGTAVSTV
ncbi:MAG: peroxidase [Hyphomicrobiales bacterium]|nr:peroxidase [Hyphomicrobiales bacterium]